MTDKIRNICLLGHGGTGKTSLTEAYLYLTGATDRLGRVADGNTVCDYDAEESSACIASPASIAYAHIRDIKLTLLTLRATSTLSARVKQGHQCCRYRYYRLHSQGRHSCRYREGLGLS